VIVGDHESVAADDETAAARVGAELLGLPGLPVATTTIGPLARTEKELERVVPTLAALTATASAAAASMRNLTLASALLNRRGLKLGKVAMAGFELAMCVADSATSESAAIPGKVNCRPPARTMPKTTAPRTRRNVARWRLRYVLINADVSFLSLLSHPM
jgi:hypothetical protein